MIDIFGHLRTMTWTGLEGFMNIMGFLAVGLVVGVGLVWVVITLYEEGSNH